MPSQSHKTSKLLLIDTVLPVDDNTVFLAHYDITENEVLYGISPITNVTTMRSLEGKFGGGVAVEESTVNLIKNGDINAYSTASYGWDSSLNGTLAPTNWNTNNNGVPSASVGYHSHINISKFPFAVIEYVDKNSQFDPGLKHRWLGASQQIASNASTLGWSAGTRVSVSFDAMVDHIDKGLQFGIHHIISGSATTFSECYTSAYLTRAYEWQRVSATYTLVSGNWDFNQWATLYIYGQYSRNDYEGIAWVKNVQIETKGFPSTFTLTSRPTGKLTYPADCINPEQGTISFWYKPEYPSSYVTMQQDSPKLIQVGEYFGNSSFTIWNFLNKLSLYVKGFSDSTWSYSSQTIDAFTQNTWGMVTVTWNGAVWKIYYNGVLQKIGTATQALGRPIAGNLLYVGGDGGDGGFGQGKAANGIIDELRIDNIARTDEEIMQWYLSAAPFYPKGIYTIAY